MSIVCAATYIHLSMCTYTARCTTTKSAKSCLKLEISNLQWWAPSTQYHRIGPIEPVYTGASQSQSFISIQAGKTHPEPDGGEVGVGVVPAVVLGPAVVVVLLPPCTP